MRPAPALLALAFTLSACSRLHLGSAGNDRTDTSVAANPAQTLQIARTQLEHHGFAVANMSDNVLVTTPKAIQRYQDDTTGAAAKGDRWFLRVETASASFLAGTHLRVFGFVVPKGASATSANGTQTLNAIPITTSDKHLYTEVRAAARWIADEADRKGPKQSSGARP